MKYIKEYSDFINEGYIDVPVDMVSIFKKIYHDTVIEYSKNNKYNVEDFCEIFNKKCKPHIKNFGCTIELVHVPVNRIEKLNNFICKLFKKDKDKTNKYNSNGICNASFAPNSTSGLFFKDIKFIDIFIDKDELGSKIINDGDMLKIYINDIFIDNLNNIEAQNCLTDIFKHEYGHKMAYDLKINNMAAKFFNGNPDFEFYTNKLKFSDYISMVYDDKNIEKFNILTHAHDDARGFILDSESSVIKKIFNAIKLEIISAKILSNVKTFIEKASKDGYSYKEIIDDENGPLSKKEYFKYKYNDKFKDDIFKDILRSRLYGIILHDSSKEEFSVNITSITSELLSKHDIKGALGIISTSTKPDTISSTFNSYIKSLGGKSDELRSIRKMVYLNLQNIANNPKQLVNSGVKLLK